MQRLRVPLEHLDSKHGTLRSHEILGEAMCAKQIKLEPLRWKRGGRSQVGGELSSTCSSWDPSEAQSPVLTWALLSSFYHPQCSSSGVCIGHPWLQSRL